MSRPFRIYVYSVSALFWAALAAAVVLGSLSGTHEPQRLAPLFGLAVAVEAIGVRKQENTIGIQVTTPRTLRSGVFAMTNSVQTAGMIVGLALAPLATAAFTTGTVLRIVAAGCAISGIVAAIGLIGAPRGSDELAEAVPEAQRGEPADLGMVVSA